MKLTKDSEVVIVNAFARGYYSDATAEGNFIIPKDIYDKNEDKIDNISIYVGELDGKHSECECDISIDVVKISHILTNQDPKLYDLSKDMFFKISNNLELNDNQAEQLNNFDNFIVDLYNKYPNEEKVKITLEDDSFIQGVEIPKGTVLKFTLNKKTNFDYEIWTIDTDLL